MNLLSMFNFKPANILKIVVFVFIGIVVLSVGFRLVDSTVDSVFRKGITNTSYPQSEGAFYSDGDYADEEFGYGGNDTSLSIRNIIGPEPPRNGGGTSGSDAEDFEITNYNAFIEARNIKRTCESITNLKALDHVIFENANEHDRGCNYTFKVERERVAEVLSIIKDLNPKELSENTHTIKRVIDDFTSETEIFEKKLATIDKTLDDAIRAYDSITALATRNQDAESLAKIIDSKIGIIERLTNQRINVTAQLDRLSRSKADQLDRLEYTYFYISVYENKFIDGEDLKDSWKAAVKGAVRDINRAIQDLTVNLVAVLFIAVQYALYFIILLFVAKYGWKFVQNIWNK